MAKGGLQGRSAVFGFRHLLCTDADLSLTDEFAVKINEHEGEGALTIIVDGKQVAHGLGRLVGNNIAIDLVKLQSFRIS